MAMNVGSLNFSAAIDGNRRRVRRCEACLKRGRLHHLILPKATLRYPETTARVRGQEHWLCDECYAKLRKAVNEEDAEEETASDCTEGA